MIEVHETFYSLHKNTEDFVFESWKEFVEKYKDAYKETKNEQDFRSITIYVKFKEKGIWLTDSTIDEFVNFIELLTEINNQ